MPRKGKKIKEKKWLDDQEKLDRLAVLIAREVDRIVFDLEFRKEVLFKLWSKERIRAPLLRVLDSRYYEIKAELLILFPPDLFRLLDDFYRTLEDFIFYSSYTEDMPQNLAQKFDAFVEELKLVAQPLMDKLKEVVPESAIELAAFEPPMPDLSEL
jgi:hypothetical protein